MVLVIESKVGFGVWATKTLLASVHSRKLAWNPKGSVKGTCLYGNLQTGKFRNAPGT